MTKPSFHPPEIRRRIVTYMRKGREYLASEIAERLDLPAPVVARQMASLHEMGIVRKNQIRVTTRPISAWALESAQERAQGGKSPVSGVTIPKTQEGPSAGRKMAQ